MRLIDADHLKRWILSRVLKSQLSVADVIDQIDREYTIEPESQIIYSKVGYIMSLHKEYGCTLTRAEEAHNKALEYLRDKAMMKG